jgi:hypothetical protein
MSYLDDARRALARAEKQDPSPQKAAVPAAPKSDDRFRDWVLRPGFHGRMGWEKPGLPEADRWWAQCFEDLPAPPDPERN